MWNKLQVSLLSSICYLVVPVFARSAHAPQLIRPGIFHTNEVSAKTGETWLGLFRTRRGYQLVNTEIVVRPAKDQVVGKDRHAYGCSVSVKQTVRPLFMVRNLPRLRPGPVPTTAAMKVLAFGATLKLKLNAKDYTIKAVKVTRDRKTISYTIVLSCAKKSQTLIARDNCDLGPQSYLPLLWAGDIDGDGNLDLLIDTTDNYNVWDPTLFLSGSAKAGQLVQMGPSFRQVGF